MLSPLKQARMKAGYSIKEVAQELHIREQYLVALEENNYSIIPGKVYADGYLKLYARYLGVSIVANPSNNTQDDNVLQNKLVADRKFSKYLVIISILMLVVTVLYYNSVLQNTIDIDVISIVENTNSLVK